MNRTPRHSTHPPRRPARGAALLVAMVLLTLVATMASAMVWQQWKGVQVESSERARVQTGWMLLGAQDWARLILREDHGPTALTEAWATPLVEARVSTFLAIDGNTTAYDGPDAFLSGAISDAQARYNLRNLLDNGKLLPAQVTALQRLCASIGLGADVATLLANGMLAASVGTDAVAPLAPQQLADLVWLGIDADTVDRLAAVAVLLPVRTAVNLNTAPREVLAAVITGIDLGGADRLLQVRQRQPFRSVEEANAVLGKAITLQPGVVDVKSAFFEVRGRLRLDHRVLNEQTLVERKPGREVVSIQRQRQVGLSQALR